LFVVFCVCVMCEEMDMRHENANHNFNYLFNIIGIIVVCI